MRATLFAGTAILLTTLCLARADEPVYRIYPLRNGVCQIAGHHAFHNGNPAESYEYALYVWLVLGGDKPILVDAGITDVVEMNRGAAHVLRKPITQPRSEHVIPQLRKFGLKPEDIGHILVTHMHFDHVDDLPLYRNAKICVGRKEFLGPWNHGKIIHEYHNNPQFKSRIVLIDDQQVLPGIESFWVGGHTPGSTAYRIRTAHGHAVLTGDTVSLLANIDKDIPVGVYDNLEQCAAAMKTIRARADIILPSHDPGTLDRWPPTSKPKYTIRAIKVGQCEVRDYITFNDSQSQDTSTYNLYVFLIEGGPKPILVETGPKYPAEFSKATAQYIPGGVKQLPDERTIEALKRHGVNVADISHVIATHLHADHYDYFDAFPNAKFVVNRREFEANRNHLAPDVKKALAARPDALQLVEEEEILPGIRAVPIGGHTPGSQAIVVQTHMGPAVLTGDTVYKHENIEKDRPTNSPDPAALRRSMARIRALADIIIPAHDPETLDRWPTGLIGAKP